MPRSAEQIRSAADAAEARLRLQVATLKGRQLRAMERSMKDRKARGPRRDVRRGRGGGMMALSGGYEAASRTRVSSGRSRVRGGSFDSFLDAQSLDYLRRDGRALMRNNPIARGIVRRCINMIAGGRGFTAHAATEDAAWNAQADAWWDEYWHDQRRCDARGLMNGDEMVRAVIRQVLIDGDVLCVPQDYGFLQFVDAERIINPQGSANTDKVVNGVELDNLGAPSKFHVAEYQGAAGAAGTVSRQTRPHDADTAWFLARQEWMSQTRGEPRLGAVSDDFERIRDYIDTTLTAAQTAAMITGIINQVDPGANPIGIPIDTQTSDTDQSTQDVGDIEPGSWMRLRTGETFTQPKAEQPTATFDSFVINLVRFVGQELDLPLEIAMMHFGIANFASAKAALTVCLDAIDSWQEWLVTSLLRRWYKWRIAMAILDGELPENKQYDKVTWTPPAKPNLEPNAKAQTDAMLVAGRFKTRMAVAAEGGLEWRSIIDQCAAEEEYLKAKGLTVAPMPGAGGNPTGGISTQQTGDSGQKSPKEDAKDEGPETPKEDAKEPADAETVEAG